MNLMINVLNLLGFVTDSYPSHISSLCHVYTSFSDQSCAENLNKEVTNFIKKLGFV